MQLKRTFITLTLAAGLVGLAACGSSNNGSSNNAAPGAKPTTSMAAPSSADAMGQFGPACGSVPTSGPGSFQGMAQAPVATAASSNPVLSRRWCPR